MADPAAPDNDRDADGPPALPGSWTAPDDPSELDLDLVAWRREQAAARRQRRWSGAHPQRAALVAAVLAVLGVAIALILLSPVGVRPTEKARSLASPAGVPGSVGALLPDVPVRVGDEARPVRSFRPTMVVLVPLPCRCTAAMAELAQAGEQYAVPLLLVAPSPDSEFEALTRAAARARTVPVIDEAGALSSAYAADGLTAVIVQSDGVVSAVERRVTPGRDLGTQLVDISR